MYLKGSTRNQSLLTKEECKRLPISTAYFEMHSGRLFHPKAFSLRKAFTTLDSLMILLALLDTPSRIMEPFMLQATKLLIPCSTHVFTLCLTPLLSADLALAF